VAKAVTIFTDGACIGNPGPGGYGAIVQYKGHRREYSGGYRRTTNNRMELPAAIAALNALTERCSIAVHSDSQYVVRAMTEGWARGWRANGWRLANKKPAINVDLWTELLRLCDAHDVSFEWIRGHSGHAENERCDALAFAAASSAGLQTDEVYERQQAELPPF
jgi:ribonuclease HI